MEFVKLTIKKFMWMDIIVLGIWAILMDVIAYFITSWIASSSMNLPITESVFIAPGFTIIYLIYHRWKDKGMVVNGLLLIVHLILYRVQIFKGYEFVLMIIVSYSAFLLTMITMRFAEKIKMSRFIYHFIAFNSIYIIMILAEYIVGSILGVNITLFGVVSRHIVNMVICSIIIIIMSIQSNLIVDMKSHLIQSKKEEAL